jgi:hypothetical protein
MNCNITRKPQHPLLIFPFACGLMAVTKEPLDVGTGRAVGNVTDHSHSTHDVAYEIFFVSE